MEKSYSGELRYGIGLDMGIASLGWAVLMLDAADEPCGILKMGSRIFPAAEVPKTGASLASERRLARGARRRCRRKAFRKERIRKLLVNEGILSKDELDRLFNSGTLEDIYALRDKGLREALSPAQFSRVLIHLAQRRGFRSNRKAVDNLDKKQQSKGSVNKDTPVFDDGKEDVQEKQKMLKAVKENIKRLTQYETAGQMLYQDASFEAQKRNRAGEYLTTLTRDMIEHEARLLFERQRNLGQAFATPQIEDSYLSILLSQRSFDMGPGDPSPYGGAQIEKMRGFCSFEKEEKRAPKASFSFECFTAYEKINHLRISNFFESRGLNDEERKSIYQAALDKEGLSYSDLRKILKLDEEQRFTVLNYTAKVKNKKGNQEKGSDLKGDEEEIPLEKIISDAENKSLGLFKAHHTLRKILGNEYIKSLSPKTLDQIAEILSCYKQDESIRAELEPLELSEKAKEALMGAPSFSKFGHLSCLACQKIIPFLKEGYNYNEACEKAGYHFQGAEHEKSRFLRFNDLDTEGLTSPVVIRAVSQTIKVLNAIIRWMGRSPVYVNLEIAREMAKPFDERKEIQNSMENNAQINEKIREKLKQDLGLISPTGQDIVKFKLYEEQGGKCLYTGEALDIRRLFDKGYAEVDHIIPYSLSFDDTQANKALVTAKANRDKGNRLPMQYLVGAEKEAYILRVKALKYRDAKKRRLLKETLSREEFETFNQRNLNDTRHLSVLMLNCLQNRLQFDAFRGKSVKHVIALNGSITAYMRKRYGLTKVRENGNYHHAVDAVVIACVKQGMITKISEYHKYQEDGHFSAARKVHFPEPWPDFRTDITERCESLNPAKSLLHLYREGRLQSYGPDGEAILGAVKPLFCSFKPDRSIKGPAHEATLLGPLPQSPGVYTKRVSLDKLRLDENGEIKDYYNPESDPALYKMLQERLIAHANNAKAAFKDKVYKPGSPNPVKKVTLIETTTLSVPLNEGKSVAKNDSMVRADVFFVKGDGYYIVPLYVPDCLKEYLPNKASIAHKGQDEWKEMKEEDFLFSLYQYDLIRVENRKNSPLKLEKEKTKNKTGTEEKQSIRDTLPEEKLYFNAFDISVATIGMLAHDGVYRARIGSKTLKRIAKYEVDLLGDITECKKEKRRPLRPGQLLKPPEEN